jgi:hypothetical protein
MEGICNASLISWNELAGQFSPSGGLEVRLRLLQQKCPLWHFTDGPIQSLPEITAIEYVDKELKVSKRWPFEGVFWDGKELPPTKEQRDRFAYGLVQAAIEVSKVLFRFQSHGAIPIYFIPQQLYVSSNWDQIAFDGTAELFLLWGEELPRELRMALARIGEKTIGYELKYELEPVPQFFSMIGHLLYFILTNRASITLFMLQTLPTSWHRPLAQLLTIENIVGIDALIAMLEEGSNGIEQGICKLENQRRLVDQHGNQPTSPILPGLIAVSGDPKRPPPFFIEIHPVTVAQYRLFDSNYQPSSYSRPDDAPATNISLAQAQKYCQWRSAKEGKGGVFRLPLEKEWEAALEFNGEQLILHVGQGPHAGTIEVSKAGVGKGGIRGLLGNCWEWTENPQEPGQGIAKGGAWWTKISECSKPQLRWVHPEYVQRADIGFRCVYIARAK